jgi:hypothetical protein
MKLRLATLLSAILAIPALAQDKPKPVPAHAKVDQEKVDEAIKKGCKYLLQSGQGMGTFPHGQRNQPQAIQAYGEIVLLTLLHSGYYQEGDVELQPIIDFLNQKTLGSTYTAALMAMALQKLNPKKYQMRIAECAQYLCDNQCENGQWDYGEPVKDPPPTTYEIPKRKKTPDDVATGGGDPNAPPGTPGASDASKAPSSSAGKTTADPKKGPGKTNTIPRIPVRKKKPGPPNGDNSNSQYAALGLRACLDAGIDVDPSVLQRARQWWTRSQNSDGGWGYNDHGNMGGGDDNPNSVSNNSYGSMTVGATGALCIYDYFMGIDYKTDGNVIKGLNWLGNNFDVTKNPKKTAFAYLYFLYGLERVGMLYGTEKMGTHEWYPEGANHLLGIQQDGVWGTDDKLPGGAPLGTCFAILFLRRGTLPLKPLPQVATGDPHRPAVANGAPVPERRRQPRRRPRGEQDRRRGRARLAPAELQARASEDGEPARQDERPSDVRRRDGPSPDAAAPDRRNARHDREGGRGPRSRRLLDAERPGRGQGDRDVSRFGGKVEGGMGRGVDRPGRLRRQVGARRARPVRRGRRRSLV